MKLAKPLRITIVTTALLTTAFGTYAGVQAVNGQPLLPQAPAPTVHIEAQVSPDPVATLEVITPEPAPQPTQEPVASPAPVVSVETSPSPAPSQSPVPVHPDAKVVTENSQLVMCARVNFEIAEEYDCKTGEFIRSIKTD